MREQQPPVLCGVVHVDPERCNSCRLCVELCPVRALALKDGKVVQVGFCIACLGCMAVCEKRAVKIEVRLAKEPTGCLPCGTSP